jgi:hypothetical protein
MVGFMVYRTDLAGKVYFGSTGLEIEDRESNMKSRPVWWLRGHPGLRRVVLKPVLARRVSLETALALEASRTAVAPTMDVGLCL